MDKVDYALKHSAAGFSVLLLSPNSKIPAGHVLQPNGVKNATRDEQIIRQLWKDEPDGNIGIACGEINNLTVIDLDGADAKIEMRNRGFTAPKTMMVQTARRDENGNADGWHLYTKYAQDVPNSTKRIPGVDIRSDNGYVVAEGSVVDGNEYITTNDFPIVPYAYPSVFKNERRNGVSPTIATKEFHQKLVDGVAEGERNTFTFDVAIYYRKQRHKEDDVSELVHSFNNKNRPPLPTYVVDTIIQSSKRYVRAKEGEYLGPMIEAPMVEAQTDRKCTFYWVEHGVRVILTELTRRKYCLLKIEDEKGKIIYAPTQYALFDERSRNHVRQSLSTSHPTYDWSGILHHVSDIVYANLERDGDIVDLAMHERASPSPFLVKPIVRTHQPTILYADGGTGKSTFALAIAATLACPDTQIIPGINSTTTQPINTMYLDWESDEDDVAEMLDEIAAGAGVIIPPDTIKYRAMSGAFMDRVDDLVDEITNNNIQLLIIDSLVASSGNADVTDAEAAKQYFNACRSLNIASIGITHTNKEGSLYGSRFFWNYARRAFRLKSINEPESDPILGLFHEKGNRGQLSKPMAWNVRYGDDMTQKVIYEHTSLQAVPELAKLSSLIDRIEWQLSNGEKDVEQLAKLIDVSESAIEAVLQRYPNKFVKNDIGENVWNINLEFDL